MTEHCSVCDSEAAPDAELLAWSRDTDARGEAVLVCPACTREHVRAIEAKLDRDWW